jgi:hypothetical protein
MKRFRCTNIFRYREEAFYSATYPTLMGAYRPGKWCQKRTRIFPPLSIPESIAGRHFTFGAFVDAGHDDLL